MYIWVCYGCQINYPDKWKNIPPTDAFLLLYMVKWKMEKIGSTMTTKLRNGKFKHEIKVLKIYLCSYSYVYRTYFFRHTPI